MTTVRELKRKIQRAKEKRQHVAKNLDRALKLAEEHEFPPDLIEKIWEYLVSSGGVNKLRAAIGYEPLDDSESEQYKQFKHLRDKYATEWEVERSKGNVDMMLKHMRNEYQNRMSEIVEANHSAEKHITIRDLRADFGREVRMMRVLKSEKEALRQELQRIDQDIRHRQAAFDVIKENATIRACVLWVLACENVERELTDATQELEEAERALRRHRQKQAQR